MCLITGPVLRRFLGIKIILRLINVRYTIVSA